MKTLVCLSAALVVVASQSAQPSVDAGRKLFEASCAPCHGGDARGGERGPSLIRGGVVGARSEEDIRQLNRNGKPAAGMPPFKFSAPEEADLVTFVHSLTAPAVESEIRGDPAAGKAFFWGKGQCGDCHMIQGYGGVRGPDLSALGRRRTLGVIEYALSSPGGTPGYQVVSVRLSDGRSFRGFARNESNYDLQLQEFDGRFHFLQREEIAEITRDGKSLMPLVQLTEAERRNLLAYLVAPSVPESAATSAMVSTRSPVIGDWPTYHGHFDGNRYSSLRKITIKNVRQLAARWIFSIRGSHRLEVTPVVVDGLMYVTTGNEAVALDARTGREIWHYLRPPVKGVVGDAGGGINRGVAVLGDRVFMVTPDAHLLALNRIDGGLVWDTEMADYRQQYGATAAPLVVKDLVISGVSGGDEGVRGFVAAYKASTGERIWRFWTMPAPGEPLSETWVGRAIEHGCVSTWMTGTYDPENDILYWTTGNPCPDYNGDERRGDNLYSDSVLAFKPETGALRWYFQFTPHDLHDWDAQETPMLIDAEFHGQKRHLLLQSNRNGFFYILDRITGEFLMAKPFVDKLTWASEIGADGRPKVLPGSEPTIQGAKVCPAVEGATNWMSSAWSPETGLFYVMALEKCNIYIKSSAWREPGKSFFGGETREVPGEPGKKVLRALDIQSGKRVWEVPQEGPANTWGGVLATAGGLVFLCDDSGAFAAVDAKTGKPLWHFHTSQSWRASPMTYMVDGKQYVAVAAGSNIIAFGL